MNYNNDFVYKDIATISPLLYLNFEYTELNNLVKQNIENNTMPYDFVKPYPQNLNIISGNSAGSGINIDKIELKARSIGAQNTLWIYGGDAELLGLELNKKVNCEPVTVQFVYDSNGDKKICTQTAYLLDQFTKESVERLYVAQELAKVFTFSEEKNLMIAKRTVNEVAKNRYRYNENLNKENAGLDSNGKRIYTIESEEDRNRRYKFMKQNITLNTQKYRNTYGYKNYMQTVQALASRYLPEQKIIFDYSVKYHINQSCPKDDIIVRFSPEQRKQLDRAFSSLLERIEKNPQISGIITRTMFEGFAVSERLTHLDFSVEPVFSREKRTDRKTQSVPKAMEVEHEHSILDNASKKQSPQRSFNMHVGQDIGL